MIGIYRIINNLNGKIYVGKSKNIKRRISEHFRDSRKDLKYPIYAAIKKYGKKNFTVEILGTCPEEYLDKLEIFFIKHYQSYKSNKGYNCTLGGEGGYGAKHSEEQKKKWSSMRKGKRWSNRTDYSTTEVEIFRIDQKGNFKLFKSIKSTGLETTSIVRACNRYKKGLRNYSQGFYWIRKEDYKVPFKIKDKNLSNNKNIELIDTLLNKSMYFKSKKLLRDFLGVKGHQKINKIIKDKKLYNNRYLIKEI